MSNGILIFSHNNSQIDYSKIAYISAKFAKKNLGVPVSLVTDMGTKEWMEKQDWYNNKIYDKIILTDNTHSIQQNRRYYDGSLDFKKSHFKNVYRVNSYDITPYDQTLVIDVDLLIVNDRLKNIWNSNNDFMINRTSHDLASDRDLFEFKRVSDHGIDFYWATAFFFRKTIWTKTFFGLCQHIIDNYEYYRFVYRIDNPLMRNDYVFSIAIHIMNGFSNKIVQPSLPCKIYYVLDKDELVEVKNDKSFKFLVQKKDHLGEYRLVKTDNQNMHIMNKFSIGRLSEKLLEVVND